MHAIILRISSRIGYGSDLSKFKSLVFFLKLVSGKTEFQTSLEDFAGFQKTKVENKLQKQNKQELSFILHKKSSKSIW